MRTRLQSVLSVLGTLLFVATTAHAGEALALAKIPFAFEVGSNSLPAGEYTVERMGSVSGTYAIRNEDGTNSIFFHAFTAEPRFGKDKDWTLVFDRLGEKNFLKNVWLGFSEEGLALPESKHERELLTMGKGESRTEIALASRRN
jgi:hypothetical protein